MRILLQSPYRTLSLPPSESPASNLNAIWNVNLNNPPPPYEPLNNLQSPHLIVPTILYLGPIPMHYRLYQYLEPPQPQEAMGPHQWNWTSISPFAPNLVDPLPKQRSK